MSVKNPEQMTHKPFNKATNPIVSAIRGWVAGTAGLPGYIEGLTRMAAKYLSAPGSLAEKYGMGDTKLPTSDFYREWLPGKSEGVGADEVEALGTFLGGVGTINLARPLAKLPGAIAKASPGPLAGSRTAQRGIIKAPGGNWLSGSPEDAVRGLKQNEGDMARAMERVHGERVAPIPQADRADAINNWIDSQLVKKYIKNEMATERDPLRLMADAWPEKKAAKLAEVQARIDALAERTRQLARERGQPEHTLTEMRQLMIPLEKEKALIEATEGLHYAPTSLAWGPGNATELRRTGAGFPEEGVAKSSLGRDWEGWSDRAIQNESAGNMLADRALDGGPSPWVEGNPWLAKVPPEVPVHRINSGYRPEDDLGFGHLIDELRNSLNPESGLPKELLMRYQDLPKVTVPQAAERVAQINAWRAAQKREADLLIANNAATVLHKDYPEKGLKWVEMKAQDPDAFEESIAHLPPAEWQKAVEEFRNGREKTLADALKYEGDQMAHCVGGYCPPVLRGESRIFSLRDAKGKPHTTIEVAPGGNNPEVFSNAEAYDEMYAAFNQARKQGFQGDVNLFIAENYTAQSHPIIKQIKGYRNQRPDDEYLPYVQDFVRSGKWSDVGDLHNTGLQKWNDRYLTREDIEALSPDEMDAFASRNVGRGFADGGLVSTGYNPSLVNARAAQLEAELFN